MSDTGSRRSFPVPEHEIEDLAVVRDLRARGMRVEVIDVREEDDRGRVRWFSRVSWVPVALVLVLVLVPSIAFARVSPALALARLCVSEAGWSCFRTGDGYAIHEVIARLEARRGRGYTEAAAHYAPRLFGRRTPTARLRWCGELAPGLEAPASWPAPPHAPWIAYRGRWSGVLEQARTVVRFTIDDLEEWGICDSPVTHWGAPTRAPPRGVALADCGPTRNRFWTVRR